MYSRGRERRTGLLVVMLLIGGIIGSVVGQALKDVLPIVSEAQRVGLTPTTVELAGILRFTFGLSVEVNLATVLGIILAILFFRRM